jgi:hypothetical protein
MSKIFSFTFKGYDHQTIMKAAYRWLPIFAVMIFICSYFDRFRFILYLSVGTATYAFIINQLKKKSVDLRFNTNEILINDKAIQLSSVENYYISLPLNELIMLRLKVKEKNEAFYIAKEAKHNIDDFFEAKNIPMKKKSYDNYLKYGHLILPFVGLLICAAMYKLYQYVQYGFF